MLILQIIIVKSYLIYGPAIFNQPDLQPKSLMAGLLRWGTSRYEWLTALFLMLDTFLVGHLIYRRARNDLAIVKISLITILGIIFFMVNAPTLRFGILWLMIPPALWIAVMRPHSLLKLLSKITLQRYAIIISSSLVLVLFFSPNNMQKLLYKELDFGHIPLGGNSRINLFMPPPMVNIRFDGEVNGRSTTVFPQSIRAVEGANFNYYASQGGCWNTPLPCGDGKGLGLLHPELGIAAGFINQSQRP